MKVRMPIGMLVLALLIALTAGFRQAQGPGVENRLQPGRTAYPADAADIAQPWAGTTIPYTGRLFLASPRDASQTDGAGQTVTEGASVSLLPCTRPRPAGSHSGQRCRKG